MSNDFILKRAEKFLGTMCKKNDRIDYDLAKFIDHTLLKADATSEEIMRLCEEALEYRFASVCVNPTNLKLVSQKLKNSGVKSVAVVGFPLGASTTSVKSFEAKEAMVDGAEEIDMVINLGALKARDYQKVYIDIRSVVEIAQFRPVKTIIETSYLSQEEKIVACIVAKTAGAAFIKTSTGFAQGGATVEDIQLIRSIIGKDMLIKASGGIKTRQDASKMIEAGANRIGASASINIVTKSSIN